MLDYNPTGDGILTSLMLIQILLEKGIQSSKVCDIIQIYPQVLINAKVDINKKNDYEKDEEINQMVEKLKKEFSSEGRIIIRPSGTEPLIRVMIEGKDKEIITKKAKELSLLIEKNLK